MRHVYFDMDGVLAVTGPTGHETRPTSESIRSRARDETAIELVRVMMLMPGNEIRILASIQDSADDLSLDAGQCKRHAIDKYMWCEDNVAPKSPDDWTRVALQSQFACLVDEEAEKLAILEAVDPKDRPDYVLIDDDPEILAGWTTLGGTGVQFRQAGIEIPPWKGMIIDHSTPIQKALTDLLAIGGKDTKKDR